MEPTYFDSFVRMQALFEEDRPEWECLIEEDAYARFCEKMDSLDRQNPEPLRRLEERLTVLRATGKL